MPAGSREIVSLRGFAKECGLSLQQVRSALAFFQATKMATQLRTHHGTQVTTQSGTVVTILNWNTYQGNGPYDNTEHNTKITSSQHSGGDLNLKEEELSREEKKTHSSRFDEFALTPSEVKPKRKSKGKPDPNYSPEFAAWYSLYPRKECPHDAAKAYAHHAAKVGHERLLASLKEQLPKLQEKLETGGDFRPYPASWLNSGAYFNEPNTDMPTTPKKRSGSFVDSVERVMKERMARGEKPL